MDEIASIALRTLAAPVGVVVVLIALMLIGRGSLRLDFARGVVVAAGLVAGDWLVRGYGPLHLDGNRRLWAIVAASLVGAGLLSGISKRSSVSAVVRVGASWGVAWGAVWFVTASLRGGRWRDWTGLETAGLCGAIGAGLVVVWISAMAWGRGCGGDRSDGPAGTAQGASRCAARRTLAQLAILAGATAGVLQLAHVASASQYAGSILAMIGGMLVLSWCAQRWAPGAVLLAVLGGSLGSLWLAGSLFVLDPPILSLALLAAALPLANGVLLAVVRIGTRMPGASDWRVVRSPLVQSGLVLGVVVVCAGAAVVLAIEPASEAGPDPDPLEELYSGW